MTKRNSTSLVIVVFVLIGGGVAYWQLGTKSGPATSGDSVGREDILGRVCLKEDETVDYTLDEKYAKEIKIPSVPTTITVRDKSTQTTKKSFEIKDFDGPSLRIWRCGIYVSREFNSGLPNYRAELWRYDYDGRARKVMTMFSFKDGNLDGTLYSGFVIDPKEKYLVLEHSYLGHPDYASVFKNLNTLEDLFVLSLDGVEEINPGVELGSFAIGQWAPDGTYIWGTLFDGPRDTAYLRIEAETWKTEVFSPPPDMPPGVEQALSLAGYLAYPDFTTFYGIDVIQKKYFERFRQEGREKHLFVYNLRTGEKQLLATASDPAWYFKPKWLSDTELEYYLPSGERKTYIVSE